MRAHYRRKLDRLLELSDDEGFIELMWATNALQSGWKEAASKFIDMRTVPEAAFKEDIRADFAIQKWEIETIVNELMCVPKREKKRNGVAHRFRTTDFQLSVACANILRKLENAEYKSWKRPEGIWIETGRLAARQFEWQIGFDNLPRLYRNTFVYGQGESAKYFSDSYGISVEMFTRVGFCLFVALTMHPVVQVSSSFKEVGLTHGDLEGALKLIARPFGVAAAEAKRVRPRRAVCVADKESVLRIWPCVTFGAQSKRIRAPLPQLILERVTSGIFYDVVGGSGPIRDDYGRRFEEYSYRHLSVSLPLFGWKQEFGYKKKPREYKSPDILGLESNRVFVAMECKATRMSHQAQFGVDPFEARGYEDLVKGVFQLWRFFSHCRRGVVQCELSDSVVGMVLTLDNWLVLAEDMRKRVIAAAIEMAKEKEPEISLEDRREVVFVAISELERLLSTANEQSFKDALISASSNTYSGWRLDLIHQDLVKHDTRNQRPYPFKEDLEHLLPWWGELRRGNA